MNMNDYNETTPSRVRKNANLYRRIDAESIDDVEPTTKEEVIESNTTTIDVEKLKSMLDKKYREPSSNTLKDMEHNPVSRDINLEETREYNLDDILNKAKDKDNTDYGVERLKKLSDTNISILDGLNIKENSTSKSKPLNDEDISEEEKFENKSKVSSDSKKLIELIDTINLKEQEGYDALLNASDSKEEHVSKKESNDLLDDFDLEDTKSNEPLDMLSELTGNDEDTKVVGASEMLDDDIDLDVKDTKVNVKNDSKKDKYDDIDLDDTDDDFDTTEVVSRDDTDEFTDSIELTTTQIFTKDDFEDFDDLKEATKPRIFVKILIFLIVIAVIIGTVFVLDRVLDLGILSRLGINF